jgi:hypothetical protein
MTVRALVLLEIQHRSVTFPRLSKMIPYLDAVVHSLYLTLPRELRPPLKRSLLFLLFSAPTEAGFVVVNGELMIDVNASSSRTAAWARSRSPRKGY